MRRLIIFGLIVIIFMGLAEAKTFSEIENETIDICPFSSSPQVTYNTVTYEGYPTVSYWTPKFDYWLDDIDVSSCGFNDKCWDSKGDTDSAFYDGTNQSQSAVTIFIWYNGDSEDSLLGDTIFNFGSTFDSSSQPLRLTENLEHCVGYTGGVSTDELSVTDTNTFGGCDTEGDNTPRIFCEASGTDTIGEESRWHFIGVTLNDTSERIQIFVDGERVANCVDSDFQNLDMDTQWDGKVYLASDDSSIENNNELYDNAGVIYGEEYSTDEMRTLYQFFRQKRQMFNYSSYNFYENFEYIDFPTNVRMSLGFSLNWTNNGANKSEDDSDGKIGHDMEFETGDSLELEDFVYFINDWSFKAWVNCSGGNYVMKWKNTSAGMSLDIDGTDLDLSGYTNDGSSFTKNSILSNVCNGSYNHILINHDGERLTAYLNRNLKTNISLGYIKFPYSFDNTDPSGEPNSSESFYIGNYNGQMDELFIKSGLQNISNSPPKEFTSPFPPSGSTGESVDLDITGDVDDPDGDWLNTYFYNAQNNESFYINGGVDTPGSTIGTWNDLSGGTTYYYYVVTDDGFATNQSDTFNFTTQYPPAFENRTPLNGTRISPNIEFSVKFIDNDNESMNVRFKYGNGTTFYSENNVPNGTIITTPTINLNEGTEYSWYVTASDGTDTTTSETWTIQTNNIPYVSNQNPLDGTSEVSLDVNLSFDIFDSDLDTMNVSIYETNYFNVANVSYTDNLTTRLYLSQGMHWGNNGSFLYEIGYDNSDNSYLIQYDCNVNYDISYCTYFGNISLDVNKAQGIDWKPNGSKFYYIEDTNDELHRYSCTNAWDISSCTSDDINYTLYAEDSGLRDIFWKPDGSKFFYAEPLHLNSYTCLEKWNLSSCSLEEHVGSNYYLVRGIEWKPDGTKFYEISRGTSSQVSELLCEDKWVLSSCKDEGNSQSSFEDYSSDVAWNQDGSIMYEMGYNHIYEYDTVDNELYTQNSVSNGTEIKYEWNGLSTGTKYGWYTLSNDYLDTFESDTLYFTTEYKPDYEINYPTNGTSRVPVTQDVILNFTIIHSDSELTNVTLYFNGTNVSSYSGVSNGTDISYNLGTLEEAETYNWSLKLEDQDYTVESETLYFTMNNLSDIILNAPADNSTEIIDNTTLNVSVSNPNGDNINVSFFYNGEVLSNQTGLPADTTVTYDWTNLTNSTEYFWGVEVDDGVETIQSEVWSFETNYVPNITSLLIKPAPAGDGDNLTFINVTEDPNGPGISAWEIKWYKNDTLQPQYTNKTKFNSSDTSPDDGVYVSLRAYDGTYWSPVQNSPEVTIGDTEAPYFIEVNVPSPVEVNTLVEIRVTVEEENAMDYVTTQLEDPNGVVNNFSMVETGNDGLNYNYTLYYTPGIVGTYDLDFYTQDGSGNLRTDENYTMKVEESDGDDNGGGGGGGGSTIVDVQKDLCDIIVEPDEILIDNDNLLVEVIIRNNEDFSYTPDISIEDVEDEPSVKNRLSTTEIGTIAPDSEKEVGIQYRGGAFGVVNAQGMATINFVTSQCKDVPLTVNMNVTSDTTLDELFTGAFLQNLLFLLDEPIVDSVPFVKVWMLVVLITIIFWALVYDKDWSKTLATDISVKVLANVMIVGVITSITTTILRNIL